MADTKGSAAIDPRLVRKLADILSDTDLTEIEVEQEGLRIRVARQVPVAAAAPLAYAMAPQAAPMAPAAAVNAVGAAAAAEEPVGETVKSPMVGTVYLQPKPGDPPFVRPGDRVAAGQTLLIVEAMKTMNPIASPRAGVVLQVLVADAQPVEFGEPLVVLE
jgi:acetyl-CoA carboxylase biotin carboxyl carrier protein